MIVEQSNTISKMISIILSRPARYFILSVFLLAIFWWVVLPWIVHSFGWPLQARVVDRWLTNVYIGGEGPPKPGEGGRLAGVKLEILLPDGNTEYIRKYCWDNVAYEGPLSESTPIVAKYIPLIPWYVIIVCDLDQSLCIVQFLFIIGLGLGFVLFIGFRKEKGNSP